VLSLSKYSRRQQTKKDCNGKQENGNQKNPKPFAPNNEKCYTFVTQIFYDEETTNG
jgi:hypothetical protein